jgi:DNA-binding transcriptional LysR family regulator
MKRQLNLRNIDLNLLPIMDALLEEECVTLASKRVHLSQSATSSALKRLRETFDDPILVRDGQRMKPSPKARQIKEALKNNLDSLAAVVATMTSFECMEVEAEVSIAAPEYVLLAMSKLLSGAVSNKARTMKLNIVKFSRQSVRKQLEDGDIELAIGGFGELDSSFRRQPLYHESLVIVMRANHPALQLAESGHMTMACFTQYSHLVITQDDMLEDAWISKFLNKHGIQRKVDAVIPNLSLSPEVLNSSDLICMGTKRTLEAMPRFNELAFLLPPKELNVSEYDVELVWSLRTDDDPALSWVRNEIMSVGRAVHE